MRSGWMPSRTVRSGRARSRSASTLSLLRLIASTSAAESGSTSTARSVGLAVRRFSTTGALGVNVVDVSTRTVVCCAPAAACAPSTSAAAATRRAAAVTGLDRPGVARVEHTAHAHAQVLQVRARAVVARGAHGAVETA